MFFFLALLEITTKTNPHILINLANKVIFKSTEKLKIYYRSFTFHLSAISHNLSLAKTTALQDN